MRFRVWAPEASSVQVVLEDERDTVHSLAAEADGYFGGVIPNVGAGTRYRFRLDGGQRYPDPCSQFQPEGPDGPSMVVDPSAYRWRDGAWPGLQLRGQVLYELHVGTFTAQGTFDAAARQLPNLAELGVACVEVMPIAEFPGRFNWGYDGVALFAPYHGYGDYDGFKRFVDEAHAHGIGVILDVVYNHIGVAGNYLSRFSPHYFSRRHRTEWGDAMNFDGPHNGPVRDFFIDNAAYWVREFHVDGLRIDATQSIFDCSDRHVLADIAEAARAAAGARTILLIAENEPQQVVCLNGTDGGGYGFDAQWNDDFHHCARVALTGRRDAYYFDYRGTAQELLSAVKYGFLFQGQHYFHQKKRRGSPALDRGALRFVAYLQNHDQVANTFDGRRIHELTSPSRLRALTALFLLAPHTPMLFMGQEFGASSPFSFFADHVPELAAQVSKGRLEFMSQFATHRTDEALARLPNPASPETFARSKIDCAERERHHATWELHRTLLRLRREDPVIAGQDRDDLDGAVLSERALVLRWFDDEHGDRLLLVNLGETLSMQPAPQPLLAPPANTSWRLMWSSEEPRFGGFGEIDPYEKDGRWHLPGECSMLLRACED